MNDAREKILQRLRNNRLAAPPPEPRPHNAAPLTLEQRIVRFTEHQSAVHGEVHRLHKDQCLNWLVRTLPTRGVRRLLAGSNELGRQLASAATAEMEVILYEQAIEAWKQELFDHIDAAVTSSRGGIADSGSLILWPDAEEPRLMSLVPPIHIALLDSDKLYQTFSEAMERENWSNAMPTNALLISGPSKTADIEQTLAYGIHGPRELITLILE
jgi:L-lactate dehydrogenase complex protein LldG